MAQRNQIRTLLVHSLCRIFQNSITRRNNSTSKRKSQRQHSKNLNAAFVLPRQPLVVAARFKIDLRSVRASESVENCTLVLLLCTLVKFWCGAAELTNHRTAPELTRCLLGVRRPGAAFLLMVFRKSKAAPGRRTPRIGQSMAMLDVTTGTLVIDLMEAKTQRIVFRGSPSDVLQRAPSADQVADAKMVTKPINKSLAKIFKKYPFKPR